MAPNKLYDQVPEYKFKEIRSRYELFVHNLADANAEVVRVFDTLGPKQQEELQLIRNVSKELQDKKEEEMRKNEQAAKEAAEAAELEKNKQNTEEPKENEAESTDSVEK